MIVLGLGGVVEDIRTKFVKLALNKNVYMLPFFINY